MNYESMLELLEEVRDMLVNAEEDEFDSEVKAEFTAKIIVTNQIMDLVRAHRDA